ncbi:RGG repeats nuclear RNA binding protein A-like [Diospyros lotus]|uniref:RGG repeats nuclear RNA binding protein A-like n=1 Tax=Diospyros lotus TaxID=55363 RepID=UPI002250921E|nr:RGG repeats nuclear RNA binding protein A-like [Diospyros lotus]
MATANPFDLLGDFDNDDPSQLIAAQQPKMEQKKALAPTQSPAQQPAARLPSKPLPPSQAVREAKTEAGRGGGRGGGRGYGRGRGRGSGFNRDSANNENSFGNSGFPGGQGATEETDIGKPYERRGGYGGPRGSFRGGRRGGFSDGEAAEGERPRRPFERRSGTGWGNEIKREGSGRGNWGTPADELAQVTEEVINEVEKNQDAEKPSGDDAMDSSKENPVNEAEEKEPEDKEMTLEEYEKVLEEKRKALLALRTEERKVDFDKEFASMQQLSNKKVNDDIFIKLGSDKDKRKEYAEKEEKTKKSVSINEFLKPAEGERYYTGRGRGRGRGPRGGYTGGGPMNNISAPKIEDPGQFPTLGAK